MGKCLLGLSARWHEPNTHCCTTLTHSHTHIHAPTFHLKSIGHHQRQRRQQQQPIWDSTKQNTTQKHWDWASIRALVRSPSMRFPPRFPVSLSLLLNYFHINIFIFIYGVFIYYILPIDSDDYMTYMLFIHFYLANRNKMVAQTSKATHWHTWSAAATRLLALIPSHFLKTPLF